MKKQTSAYPNGALTGLRKKAVSVSGDLVKQIKTETRRAYNSKHKSKSALSKVSKKTLLKFIES